MNKMLLSFIFVIIYPTLIFAAGYSWTLPTTNADGTPLEDLAGSRLYCNGVMKADIKAPANTYDNDIPCKALTVRCYDTHGNESGESNTLKTIAPSPASSLKKK